MKNIPQKFLIIDGSNLMYRAFFALPSQMKSKSGRQTNAVFGFTNMLIKLLSTIKPQYVAVAFDKSKKNFRTQLYANYKAKRAKTPVELSEQFPLAIDIIKAFGIKVLEDEHYEADDIIGTLSAYFYNQENTEILIASGDKDVFQLINDHCFVLYPQKSTSETLLITPEVLFEKYQLHPQNIIDFKALTGDTSDNIPGIKGIGEKTALKLLSEYDTLQNLLQSTQTITNKTLRQKIENYKEDALLSQKLATIVKSVPLSFKIEDFVPLPQLSSLEKIFHELNFSSLFKKLSLIFNSKPQNLKEKNITPVLSKNNSHLDIIDIEEIEHSSLPKILDSFILKTKNNNLLYFFIFAEKIVFFTPQHLILYFSIKNIQFLKYFDTLLYANNLPKVTYDLKQFYRLCLLNNFNIPSCIDDILLMSYLDNPSYSHTFTNIYNFYSNTPCNLPDKNKSFKIEHFTDIALNTDFIYNNLKSNFKNNSLLELYQKIELPLSLILAKMECLGIAIDQNKLNLLNQNITKEIDCLQNKILELAGENFNLNSPKQLSEILFNKLTLPKNKKNKTGYSTNIDVLKNLVNVHPIIKEILRYRSLTKLQSTYLNSFLKLQKHSIDGRIHTTFNQTITTTGRLSSSEPNLQNIPIRNTEGKQIREIFVPATDYDFLVSADYSQIELRILAHLSQDPTLLNAFKTNQDIHLITASEIFNIPLDKVTSDFRFKAKAVNFGIIYGISDYGLAEDINVPRKEAKLYIEQYFKRYPFVKIYLDKAVQTARENGFCQTILGRIRYLPDINHANFNIRSFAERTAMNTPVQGSAADIIKKAMIDLHSELNLRKMQSRILLQIHDELILETKKKELEELLPILKNTMENTIKLNVPLVVDINVNQNLAKN